LKLYNNFIKVLKDVSFIPQNLTVRVEDFNHYTLLSCW